MLHHLHQIQQNSQALAIKGNAGDKFRGVLAVEGDANSSNCQDRGSRDEGEAVEERALAIPQVINQNGPRNESYSVLGRYNEWVTAYRERQMVIAAQQRHYVNVTFWMDNESFYRDLVVVIFLLPMILLLSQGAKMIDRVRAIWLF